MNRRKRVRFALLAAVLALAVAVLAGCGSSASAPSTDQSASSSSSSGSQSTSAATASTTSTQESGVHTPTYKPNGKETALIKTSKGNITVKFYAKDAPIAVANFIELARKGYYDGIKFHRYEPGFVIQGGDPQTKSASAQEVAQAAAANTGRFGTGGPGYSIADEYASNPNKHLDGTLAMARAEAPNTGGSQFYFSLAAWPEGDNQYTIFGQATSGLAVIHALRAGDEIKSVTIENATK